jgi:thiamine pyrophosphate-dependent acetolactate synthase large subunit-like protein
MMSHMQALEVLARHRGSHVVVTTMTSAGIWPKLSDTPLDFAYIPSSMGQGPALGLGIALAHPQRGVIVVNGDGCTLMNLGGLVTLAAYPANVYLVVMDNGQYEVTGGQPTAGSGVVDFPTLARGAGLKRVFDFPTLADWEAGAAGALNGTGPVFIRLTIEARSGQKTPAPPRP